MKNIIGRQTCWVAGVLAIALTAGSTWTPQSAFAELRTNFGQEWVRTHPFMINGWSNTVTGGVSPEMFGRSGLNTFTTAGGSVIETHAAAGFPWVFSLNATSLTQTIKDEANHIYSTYSGGVGWMIKDEPNESEYAGVGEVSTWLKSRFPETLIYSNMGGYADDFDRKVEDFINIIQPDVLMYDYYPCAVGSEAKVDNFFNWALGFRAKGREFGIPYFAYLQSYDGGNYRYPSESEIRWEAFSYLTMGYKGLSYYRYCANNAALVVGPTTKGPMYDYVAAMNPEILSLGNVLTHCNSTTVHYIRGPNGRSTPSQLSSWSAGAGGDEHITNIQVLESGYEKNGLIGFFNDDNGEEVFMLTNLNHGSSASAASTAVTFRLTFDGSVNSLLCWDRVADEQTIVALSNHMLEVALPGGTGNLYKYNDGRDFLHYEIATAADAIHSEPFVNDTGAHVALDSHSCGWHARHEYNDASEVVNASGTSGNLQGKISKNAGADGAAGYLYMEADTEKVTADTEMAAYAEASLDRSVWNIQSFSWQMSNNSADNAARVIFRIDDNWYASEETFSAAGSGTTWTEEEFAFNADAGVWRSLDFDVDGGTGGNIELGGLLASALPAGNVTAAGIYVNNNGSSTGIVARIDDVTIDAVNRQVFFNDTGADIAVDSHSCGWRTRYELSAAAKVLNPSGKISGREAKISRLDGHDDASGFLYLQAKDDWVTGETEFMAYMEETVDRKSLEITAISWQMFNDCADTIARVAVRIGDTWYVSDETFSQTAWWREQVFDFSTDADDWRELDFDIDGGSGSDIAVGDLLNADLPDGDVTAFGLYFSNNDGASLIARVDDFTVSCVVSFVPEPGTAALLLMGAACLLFRFSRLS